VVKIQEEDGTYTVVKYLREIDLEAAPQDKAREWVRQYMTLENEA
jgi:hypothetical protein